MQKSKTNDCAPLDTMTRTTPRPNLLVLPSHSTHLQRWWRGALWVTEWRNGALEVAPMYEMGGEMIKRQEGRDCLRPRLRKYF